MLYSIELVRFTLFLPIFVRISCAKSRADRVLPIKVVSGGRPQVHISPMWNTISYGHCQLWAGPVDKYGRTCVRIPHAGTQAKLHFRWRAFPCSQNCAIPLEASQHVSHLCHNKKCIFWKQFSGQNLGHFTAEYFSMVENIISLPK